MDKIAKALSKFSAKEKNIVKETLLKIYNDRYADFDIKKLKGRDDIYRVRKGKIRIIFKIGENKKIFILTIEKRADTTYNL